MKKRPVLLIAMFSLVPSAFAALGDLSTDLVFVPVTPCRVFDTRPAQGGTGPIAAAGTKSFVVSGVSSFTAQGGSATNCGVVDGTNVAAAAINTTVVLPAAGGYITAYPQGTTQPLAATVNFNAGDVRGNMAIVKIGQTGGLQGLTIYSSSATNVVGDIVGYYTRPAATALECTVPTTEQYFLPAGDSEHFTTSICATGYSAMSPYCFNNNNANVYTTGGGINGGGAWCGWSNQTGSGVTVTQGTNCCRIPGR